MIAACHNVEAIAVERVDGDGSFVEWRCSACSKPLMYGEPDDAQAIAERARINDGPPHTIGLTSAHASYRMGWDDCRRFILGEGS